MKLIVDRIEDEVIVCENLETKELIELSKNEIGFSVVDGDVLSFFEGNYVKDQSLKKERLRMLREKFNRVKRKKDIE